MINKRGLTPREFDDLPDELFDYLMVYDAYIEPSGTKIDMLFHAHDNYNRTINNPNMTKEIRNKIKVNDFDFLDILGSNSTIKEKNMERKKALEEKQANDIRALGEQMKKMALRNNNGEK